MATIINLTASSFKRVIMHTIIAKEKDSDIDSATYELSDSLIILEEDIENELKIRMSEALGHESRSFKLKIGDVSESSFYSMATMALKNDKDDIFILQSKLIASRLAQSQKRPNIPGGYLIIIEGESVGSKFLLVMKAELQNALKSEKDNNGSIKIELIKDLFLTPASRFYKVGLLFEDDNEEDTFPNSNFSVHIFDDQFRPGYNPAEFFYSDFLGFSINDNDKLKTYRWFLDTVDFVTRRVPTIKEQNRIVGAIKSELRNSLDTILNPETYRDKYIALTKELSDQYSIDILIDYPHPFVKNTTLIEFSLNKKKVFFPEKIKIEGPEEAFNDCIEFIENYEEIENHDFSSPESTIVRIKGIPSFN
jgi:hypothetical protein